MDRSAQPTLASGSKNRAGNAPEAPGAIDPAVSPGNQANCRNCGAALAGRFCHLCGQNAHVHRSLGGFLHDLAHGAFHFEGRFWTTLPLLVWRPGELTRRYIQGQRARFISPMALFLFSVFLLFAVFQIGGISPPTNAQVAADLARPIETARQQAEADLAEARRLAAGLPPGSPERAAAETDIRQIEDDLAGFVRLQERAHGFEIDFGEAPTGISLIDKGLAKWRDNPGLMLYKLQANSYKFSWLLIPLSLPFMWLLFAWKRRFTLYDHAIFVTYSLSFMTLWFVAGSLLVLLVPLNGALGAVLFLVPILHLYRQLRGAYGLSRGSALWRLAALLCCILVVAVLFMQALLLLGAL